MEKILKVTDVKRNIKYIQGGRVLSYIAWVITLCATPTNLAELPLLAAYLGFTIGEDIQKAAITKTEEFKRLKMIYQYVLDELVKLSNKMEIKSPIAIYTLYNFLYNNDKFTTLDYNARVTSRFDKYMLGELCLNNHGVCRHIAKMLMDLYHRMGYESSVGVCAQLHSKAVMRPSESINQEDVKKMFEELKASIQGTEKDMLPDPSQVLVLPPIEIIEEEVPLTRREKKYGNHAITLVNDANNTYYLDAYNSGIYVTNPDDPTQMIDESHRKIVMKPKGTKLYLNRAGISPIETKPERPLEEMYEEACTVGDNIVENLDTIDNFYDEIKPPLEEAEEIIRLILK